jgi:hypothetical protein
MRKKHTAKQSTRANCGGVHQIISYTNSKAANNPTNNIGITPLHNAANHGNLEL